jgi:hypothetical protein
MKRDMMHAITQMAINTQLIQNSMGTTDANIAGGASGSMGHHGGGASGSNGNPAGSSGHQTPTHTYISARKIPKPLFPQFQGGQQIGHPGQGQQMGQAGQGQTGPIDPFAEYRGDYLALGPEFHADMSLMDYCSIRYRNRPREAQRGSMQP